MRAFALFIILLCSTTASQAQKDLEVGDWVLLKGTTEIGPRKMEMTQKYAIVGQEEDTEGNRLLWFETVSTEIGGRNHILTKVLVPVTAFELGDVTSAEFYNTARRWIVKMGGQPAMELPVELAMQQMQSILGLQDPDAKVEALGADTLETPKGKLYCAKKHYQGKTSIKQPLGRMIMTITNTYDRTTWHTDQVPIIGFARLEDKGSIQSSAEDLPPGSPQLPPPRETLTRIDLADFGQGAESAIVEEPVPLPAGMLKK